jgi:iron complex outermembrane receptor protein
MRIKVVAAAIGLSIVGIAVGTEADAGARQATNIAAQELAPALQTLARERDVQVVYRSELVGDHRTSGATGNLTFEEALRQLLDGTGLTYRYLADKAITIVAIPSGSSSSSRGKTGDRNTSNGGGGSKRSPR